MRKEIEVVRDDIERVRYCGSEKEGLDFIPTVIGEPWKVFSRE